MAPILYMLDASPPVRGVLMVAKHLNLNLVLKEVNLLEHENLKPDFVEKNPAHTVPFLDDNGFYLFDSHAITPYLVEKYAENDSLYPKDLEKRTRINERLHFNNGTLFNRLLSIARPIIFHGKKFIDYADETNKVYEVLERFLEKTKWIALDVPTVADYNIVSTISSLNVLVPIDNKFPKLKNWLQNCEDLPGYEANKKGLELFAGLIKQKLAQA